MELDSNFRLKKCAKISEEIDMIRQLPDEIISHILSFLPMKDAVATSILSSRWSNSWKYIPNLNFVNHCYFSPNLYAPIGEPIEYVLERSLNNTRWVNSVLNSYRAIFLRELTFSFHLHPNDFCHVSNWLHFAFSRHVERLTLDLEGAPFVLDLNILSGIQSSDCGFLRELMLKNLEVTGEAIEFLLRNCSVLDKFIMNATLTSDLVVGGTLKYLEMCPRSAVGKFTKVSAPNLTRLRSSNFDNEKLLLENVPNLVEASFNLYGAKETMLCFAKAAAGLESLTITLIQPEVFPVPQMPRLKKLVLDYASVKKRYRLPVTCLLQASPSLEEFKLEISDRKRYFYEGYVIRKAIFEVPKQEKSLHDHLKVFEFSGFCDVARDHVKLVMYIVNNCVALEEMRITPISTILARQYTLKHGSEYDKRKALSEEVEVVEEEEARDRKESAENVLAGKLPHHIKLIVD